MRASTRPGTDAYRRWADAQKDLPLSWQPRWLDIVSGTWEAASDDWASPRWVWPYHVETQFGLRRIALPPATAYLGPRLLTHDASLPLLPPDMSYGLFTSHDAKAVWAYPRRLRAMASLRIDLRAGERFGKGRRIELRSAKRVLQVDVAVDSDWAEVEALLDASPGRVARGLAGVLAAAGRDSFGEVLLARDASGKIHGMIAYVFDATQAYYLAALRPDGADGKAGFLLFATAMARLRQRGLSTFELQAGFIPGTRYFLYSAGAEAHWYAQVRVARGPFWRGLEALRARTNPERL